MIIPALGGAMILIGLGVLIGIGVGARRQRAEERRRVLESAETVADALRVKAESDSYLQSFALEFAETSDGGLEILLDGEKYNGIANLPDEKMKKIFLAAVKEWNNEKNR